MVAQLEKLAQSDYRQSQFPIKVKVTIGKEPKEYYLKKLYEFSIKSIRNSKRPQLEELAEEQIKWVLHKMNAPDWTWQRWDGLIEEWTPWNRFGEWIDQRRYYKS